MNTAAEHIAEQQAQILTKLQEKYSCVGYQWDHLGLWVSFYEKAEAQRFHMWIESLGINDYCKATPTPGFWWTHAFIDPPDGHTTQVVWRYKRD